MSDPVAKNRLLAVNPAVSVWVSASAGTGKTTVLTDRLADDVAVARARQLFARVLDTPGGAKIATIHAFCQSLLRRFPLEAGVPPEFTVIDERSAAEAQLDARASVIADARAGKRP